MVQTSTGGGACFVSGGRGFTFNFLGDGLAGQKMAVSRPQKRKLRLAPGGLMSSRSGTTAYRDQGVAGSS